MELLYGSEKMQQRRIVWRNAKQLHQKIKSCDWMNTHWRLQTVLIDVIDDYGTVT